MKSQMIWTGVVLVLMNIIGFFALAMWWQNHHVKIVVVPAAVQSENATVVTNNGTNLVPGGTNGYVIEFSVQPSLVDRKPATNR